MFRTDWFSCGVWGSKRSRRDGEEDQLILITIDDRCSRRMHSSGESDANGSGLISAIIPSFGLPSPHIHIMQAAVPFEHTTVYVCTVTDAWLPFGRNRDDALFPNSLLCRVPDACTTRWCWCDRFLNCNWISNRESWVKRLLQDHCSNRVIKHIVKMENEKRNYFLWS